MAPLRRSAPLTARVGGQIDAVLLNDTIVSNAHDEMVVPRKADGGLDWSFTGPDDDWWTRGA